MVYVFSVIREIKTMRLDGTNVVSELMRNIYSVRFLGQVIRIDKQKNKVMLLISDNKEEIETIMYPKISINAEKIGTEIKEGDKIIAFAHLEPLNNICYIDFLIKPSKIEELRHLTGLFTTYFRLYFGAKKDEPDADKNLQD